MFNPLTERISIKELIATQIEEAILNKKYPRGSELQSENELIHIYTQPINMGWESNIMFPTDKAILGINANYSQIKQINPLFTEIDSLWFISSSSPAVDSATGVYDYVIDDFNGQQRLNLKDIGADEYSSDSILRKPLTANDVGPYAEEIVTSVESSSSANLNPGSFILFQNYPNPFNPSTSISFQLPVASQATLKIYDTLGKEVVTLVDEYREAGSYNQKFKAGNLASGVYIYTLRAGSFIASRELTLLK